MSKYISQQEANKFFDDMVDERGPHNVTHQLLADSSGITLQEAYILYMNWFTNLNERQSDN
tara:strand:+ start:300 stop:482 length:183 start_codon:yes stop_codon:yes gene_type:complete